MNMRTIVWATYGFTHDRGVNRLKSGPYAFKGAGPSMVSTLNQGSCPREISNHIWR